MVCFLPRYVTDDGKVKVIDVDFAPKHKGYTNQFSVKIIETLQLIRVQSTVAKLFQTTPYIVRSIMNDAVDSALEHRGNVNDLQNVSLDEKAYTKGHRYATILIDSDND